MSAAEVSAWLNMVTYPKEKISSHGLQIGRGQAYGPWDGNEMPLSLLFYIS